MCGDERDPIVDGGLWEAVEVVEGECGVAAFTLNLWFAQNADSEAQWLVPSSEFSSIEAS